MTFEIQTFDTLSSTNNYLTDLSKKNAKPWTVIRAKNQTAGKGYAGNVWKVEKDANLTFSFYLKTAFNYKGLIFLNEWISVVLRNFLNQYISGIYVKWPNDIIVQNKKIAGILIESYRHQNEMHSIIGIGLNVNQTNFEEISKATSLKILTDKKFDVDQLLTDLMSSFFENYPQLEQQQFDAIHQNYQNHLFRKDQVSDFVVDIEAVKGIIRNSDENGLLWVEFLDGQLKSFQHKEIQLIY